MNGPTPDPTPEDQHGPFDERLRRFYAEGSRLIADRAIDVTNEFNLPLRFVEVLRKEGEKMMRAVAQCRGDRGEYARLTDALRGTFDARMASEAAAFDALYDELADELLAEAYLSFGTGDDQTTEGEGTPPEE